MATRTTTSLVVALLALLAVLTTVSCGSRTPSSPEVHARPPVVVAAGDIASCRTEGDEATAELVEGSEGTVLALGDEACREPPTSSDASDQLPVTHRYKVSERFVDGYDSHHAP